MNEEWRDIKGYEGLYQVSNMGKVKSLPRKIHKKDNKIMNIKERILSPCITGDGYLRVRLLATTEGKQGMYLVHRLVANAFIENPFNKTEVNHIDENKKNNKVDNLEWVTHNENMLHSYEKIKENHYKKLKVEVVAIKPDGDKIFFDSIKSMANSLDIKIPTAHTYVQESKIYKCGRFKGWCFTYAKNIKKSS